MASAMFLSNKIKGVGDVDAITFDAIENFKVSQTAQITTHPVEDGSSPADSYVLGPKKVSFQGVVTPWNFSGSGSDLTPLQLIQKFELTMLGKKYFDLFLSEDLQSIRDCLITKFEYDRQAKDGQSIIVSVDVQQVELVPRAEEADISEFALAASVAQQGQSKVDGGDAPVVDSSALNRAKSLVSITKTLGGVDGQ